MPLNDSKVFAPADRQLQSSLPTGEHDFTANTISHLLKGHPARGPFSELPFFIKELNLPVHIKLTHEHGCSLSPYGNGCH